MRQVPEQHLGMVAPDRARTVRDLGYHIFRLSLAYREAMEQGYLPKEWLQEGAPPEIPDGPAIALYGKNVRGRLSDWLGRPEGCRGIVNSYYGPQTAHELLERTTWHAAQHLRQLYVFLERMEGLRIIPLRMKTTKGCPSPRRCGPSQRREKSGHLCYSGRKENEGVMKRKHFLRVSLSDIKKKGVQFDERKNLHP
jgi:hypothetical protein